MIELAGKGVIVAGARRMGAVVASRLASEGVNLAITYRSSRKEAEALREGLSDKVERVTLIQADLANEAEVKKLIQKTQVDLGDLSFVVNLASDFPRTPYDSLISESWDEAMSFAKGSYLLALHASRVMMSNSGPTRGHIIQFSDWASSETPYRNYLPYLTAKASIEFMTRAFAVELAEHGVLVNTIAPGPTMRPPDIEEAVWRKAVVDHTPLKRESSTEEMAEFIVSLLRSETITGEVVRVDSGRHLAGARAE